jgi:Uma2 family endonuclease
MLTALAKLPRRWEMAMNAATTMPSEPPADGLPDFAIDVPTMFVDEADCELGDDGLPNLYEDEGQDEMGETSDHTDSTDILLYALRAHFATKADFDVRANLNLYYRPSPQLNYVSPDVMVTRPPQPLPRDLPSYRIGKHGPAPVFVAEVLSRRSFQQRDLTAKPVLYFRLKIAEYLLIDVSGQFLPQQLLLRRPADGGKWIDAQDADGGITSNLGFRVIVEADGQIRVIDAATGHRYLRPSEAEEARREADARIRQLEAELARLRGGPAPEPKS